jgi:hypothetical protein
MRIDFDSIAFPVAAIQFDVFRIQGFTAQNLHCHFTDIFHLHHVASLFVVQVSGHVVVHTHGNSIDMFVLQSQRETADYFDRHALGRFNQSATLAAGAIVVNAPLQTGADSLASHLDQSKRTRPQDFGSRPVTRHRVAKRSFDLATMTFLPHVDEVIDNHSTQVA